MARHIVLIAREFLCAGIDLDQRTSRYVDTQRELHAEVYTELLKYGIVSKRRTSGICPRMDTPPLGVPSVDENASSSTLHLNSEQRKELPSFFHDMLPLIGMCDCVVIVRDGQNDLRGAIVMHVHGLNIPMLALQYEPKDIHLPGDPLYALPNIVNVRFHHFLEAKQGIKRFMDTIPVRSYAAG